MNLKTLLIDDEGKLPYAYQDSKGFWTIGVGRLIDKRLGGGLSEDEIDYLLNNDIAEKTKECETFPWFHDLNEARQAVIISMVFNMGLSRFKGFKKTIRYLEQGDFEKASIEMLDSQAARDLPKRYKKLSIILRTGEFDG